MEKNNPFKVPDTYFDDLENTILSQTIQSKKNNFNSCSVLEICCCLCIFNRNFDFYLSRSSTTKN
jgi:hypothetical protein